jgi:hypothetical protein
MYTLLNNKANNLEQHIINVCVFMGLDSSL